MGVKVGTRWDNTKYTELEVVEFDPNTTRVVITAEVDGVFQRATAVLRQPSGAKAGAKESK